MHAALEKCQVRFEVQRCQGILHGAESSTLSSLHEATCSKNEAAVGNDWSGYSKLPLLFQENIGDGYCGIFY